MSKEYGGIVNFEHLENLSKTHKTFENQFQIFILGKIARRKNIRIFLGIPLYGLSISIHIT